MLTRRIAAVAAATLVTTAAACGNDANTGPAASPSATTAATTSPAPTSAEAPSTSTPAGREGDVRFAQMMIPHHEQAVDMADMALEKPDTSPAVTALATQIKAAQQPEIDTMTTWLKSWNATIPDGDGMGGMGHSGHGGMTGMMTEADMATLDAADGAAFDRMWLQMMIAHHEGAVTMARQVLATTKDPDVSALATRIVATQNTEIATMKKARPGR